MRIAIPGASGRTGRHLVDQALAAGLEVSAFVRDASKLPREHERLRIERGDAMDPAAVEAAVRGNDAVISVILPASPGGVPAAPLTRVVQESGLDWTIVRMAGPSNAPGTGYIDAGYVSKVVRTRIARADAAAFMLGEVLEPRFLHEAPVIWSRRPRFAP